MNVAPDVTAGYGGSFSVQQAALTWAAITARRANWRQFGTAVAVVVGITGVFEGAAGS